MASFPSPRSGSLRGLTLGALTLLAAAGAGCTSGGGKTDPPGPQAPSITTFTATPDVVDAGQGASLLAVFANGTAAVTPGIGAITTGAAVATGALTETTTFTLTVTGAGGATATRQATVTVRPAAGPGTVTVVRRATSGALEPVEGVAIHRSVASTGAFAETRTTDASGVADFGDVGASRTTLSIVRPAAGGVPKTVVSFVGVPVGAVQLRLDRLPGPRDVLASATASLSPSGFSAAVLLPSAVFTAPEVTVARQDLQADGKVTFIGRTGGGESGPLACGSRRDGDVPASGASVAIAMSGSPVGFGYSAGVPVSVSLAVRRKDAVHRFTQEGTYASGDFWGCAGELPDADTFAVTATQWVATVQTPAGWSLVDTTKWRRATAVGAGPSLPEAVSFTMPDLVPDGVSYAAGAVRAAATGALAAGVDLAVARVVTPDLAWHVYAPGGAALDLPEVPGATPPAWSDDVDVDAELVAAGDLAGFDALWTEARRLGSIDAALLATAGYATAALRMTRFTPSYTIWFDGYSWERYGLVTSDNGVHCGASCSGSWPAGTTATLTATPNPGAEFRGWGGDCSAWGTTSPVHVLVDRDYGCYPSFGPATAASYSLTVNVAGGWQALITSDDGQIKCGDDPQGRHFDLCSTTGNSGYGLTLTAAPAMTTVVFDPTWQGDCAGTGWSTFVALGANRTCAVQLTPRAP